MAAFDLTSLLEKLDSISPANASFTLKSGKAVWPYFIPGPQPVDLQNFIPGVLGTVDTSAGTGRIKRTPPLQHPIYPTYYASGISSLRGIGKPVKTASPTPNPNAPGVGFFGLYSWYEAVIEFLPYVFPVLRDDQIQVAGATYYNENGVLTPYTSTTEYIRYTDFEYIPLTTNTVTAEQGFMAFFTQSGNQPGKTNGTTPGFTFTGKPTIPLPDSTLRVLWAQVPYRYITSQKSYLNRFRGYVNQYPFYVWDRGSLLYIGYKPTRYSPPVPGQDQWARGIFSYEKWVDVELTFMHTSRQNNATDVPYGIGFTSVPGFGPQPDLSTINSNWVLGGWNLQPWLQKPGRFYYTGSVATEDSPAGRPMFQSCPMDILFTDPDI